VPAHRIRAALAVVAIASAMGLLASNVDAQSGAPDTSNSVSREHDAVNVATEHHYNSPAERAQDDLLITEVKSALADAGVSDNYPVAVDCDHGKILLSGVVKSAAAAKHAGDIAAAAQGVTGVNNQLTWH
jgi:osmotically-inducible protein OsmY